MKLPIRKTLQPVYDLLTTYSSLEDKPSASGLSLKSLFVSIKSALGLLKAPASPSVDRHVSVEPKNT